MSLSFPEAFGSSNKYFEKARREINLGLLMSFCPCSWCGVLVEPSPRLRKQPMHTKGLSDVCVEWAWSQKVLVLTTNTLGGNSGATLGSNHCFLHIHGNEALTNCHQDRKPFLGDADTITCAGKGGGRGQCLFLLEGGSARPVIPIRQRTGGHRATSALRGPLRQCRGRGSAE